MSTDNRGRVSLGKILEANRNYRVSVSSHGTVVLEPVTTISDYERKLLANPEMAAQLASAATEIERGEVRRVQRRSRD
ncbi:MAG: hypothetical protein ACO1N6_07710 [Microcella sp.]